MELEEILEISTLQLDREQRLLLQELYELVKDRLEYLEREDLRILAGIMERKTIQMDAEQYMIFSDFVKEAERIIGSGPFEVSARFINLIWQLEDCLGNNAY